MDWHRYGITPCAGGMQDQPWEWKLVLDLAMAAKEAADFEIAVDEERAAEVGSEGDGD